jgi:hemerythrin
MAAISWTEELSVGVAELDDQHKRLVDLINVLAGPQLPPDQLAEAAQATVEYAARHFNDEESHILDAAPELVGEHFELHARFIEVAYDFLHRLAEGRADGLQAEMFAYLSDWLIHHIRDEDRKYRKG